MDNKKFKWYGYKLRSMVELHPKYGDIEIWKDVPGYEGHYQVSSWGNVKSLDRVINRSGTQGNPSLPGRLLSQQKNDKGYLRVRLCLNAKNKTARVSRLVALAFVPNPDNLPEVNHDDLDKENNHYKNLSWSTRIENIHHAFKNRVIRRYKNELNVNSKAVAQYDLGGKLIQMWPSMQEAARNGYSAGPICRACQGQRETYKGYIWK